MAYTTTDLLSAIARRAFSPTDQQTFANSEILALADEEIETLLLAEILGAREEFFVTSVDEPILQGVAEYNFPARAVGNSLREVKLVLGSDVRNLPRVELENFGTTSQGSPEQFYLRENKIGLYPTPSASNGTLRLWYARYPSKLVETFAAPQIATVSGLAVTVTAAPPSWGPANTFDVLSASGPIGTDLSISGISGNTLTFTALPAGVAAGQYLALAGESPLVQLPREYRTVLAQAVTVRILSSMRLPGVNDERQKLKEMLEQTRKLIAPRVVGENRVIVNNNWFQ